MSDQTPNSSEDLNGAEPSMEDILASIRKIISEDEPVALESPEDVAPVKIVGAEPATDIDNILPEFGSAPSETIGENPEGIVETSFADDDGMVDINVDDVLASLDDDLASDAQIETAEMAVSTPTESVPSTVSVNGDLESDDDILSFLDDEIPLESDTVSAVSDVVESEMAENIEDFVSPSAEIVPAAGAAAIAATGAAIVSNTPTSSVDDVEIDSLLDDILAEPEDEVLDFAPQSRADSIFGTLDTADETFMSQEESDLELVKSLMADLADDPGDVETEEDIDELLAIPEFDETKGDSAEEDSLDFAVDSDASDELDSLIADAGPAEAVVADEITIEEGVSKDLSSEDIASDEDDDILGEILDMTLDDELEAQPDDIDIDALTSLDEVAAAEQDNILENAIELEAAEESIAEPIESIEVAEDEPLSLADIAAAAEADAVSVENDPLLSPLTAVAGTAAGALGLAALGAKADALGVEAELADVTAGDPVVDTIAAEIEVQADATVSTSDIEIETQTETLSTQETTMPVKAVKTDTIIDDVTETAAAGAFAELNQVVEDKAIFNERGPRIGDLVQDALRPMLKEWLDANLKGIVERAVTKEVKRISKGQ